MNLRHTAYTFVLFSAQYSFAGTPCIQPKVQQPHINAMYVYKEFRILYSNLKNSPHFIPDQTDLNKNKVPDYVENIAIQASATTQALTALGFMHPLQSPRYKDQAKSIDITIKAIPGNGLAYELPQISKAAKQLNQQQCALNIVIRHNLENFPGTWSLITHELFHLYQYGYTQFKNPWYLEGMTNSLERLIRKNVGNKHTQRLPQSTSELKKQVFSVPYNHMWHRLGFLAQQNKGKLPLKNTLLQAYYSNGDKVFRDDVFYGWLFIRKFLENAQARSLKISQSEGLEPYNWPEARQRSVENNVVLLHELQNTMRDMNMIQTKEEKKFLELR